MIDTLLRKYLLKFENKAVKPFVKLNISPFVITVVSFITGLSSSVVLFFGMKYCFLILLWMSGLFDMLDGTAARALKKNSPIGAVADLLSDRLVESSIVLAFYFFNKDLAFPLMLFLCSIIFNFSTFLTAGSLFKNNGIKSMYYDTGIIERTETFIIFTVSVIFVKYNYWIFIVSACLIYLTGILRSIKIYRIAGGKNDKKI